MSSAPSTGQPEARQASVVVNECLEYRADLRQEGPERWVCEVPDIRGVKAYAATAEAALRECERQAIERCARAKHFVPHPNDMKDFEDPSGDVELTAEQSEAYLRWLETGEGPCPVDHG